MSEAVFNKYQQSTQLERLFNVVAEHPKNGVSSVFDWNLNKKAVLKIQDSSHSDDECAAISA